MAMVKGAVDDTKRRSIIGETIHGLCCTRPPRTRGVNFIMVQTRQIADESCVL
jgi:hypothetical protein